MRPASLTAACYPLLPVLMTANCWLASGYHPGSVWRSNFNKVSAWPQAVRAISAEGLHPHDLMHNGNHFAAASGAGLKDLMARIGHDSERAAIIYQHEARGADLTITRGIDAHIEAANPGQCQATDRLPGTPLRSANGPLIAHGGQPDAGEAED
jgi:hypothetical protein